MPNLNILSVLLTVFVSPVSLYLLWSAAYSLYSSGKSKTRLKKIAKTMKLWQKLFFLYPLDQANVSERKAKKIYKTFNFLLIIFSVCIFLLMLTAFFPTIQETISYCVLIKLIVLDVPINLWAFLVTKHGKNGGVVWKWEERKRK